MPIEGGETNCICLSTSQELLRGSPVVQKEVQLHDEMKHTFINTESNIMFSLKAYVDSYCLMHAQQTLYCITCVLCTHVTLHSAGQIKALKQQAHRHMMRQSTKESYIIRLHMHECTPWLHFGSLAHNSSDTHIHEITFLKANIIITLWTRKRPIAD